MTAPFSPVTASAAALAVEGSRWIWEPLAIRLGTATSANCANSSDALNLAYIYASSDNGNVLSQAINRHGVYNTQSYSFSATQSYNSVTAYDGVNRLKSFSEPPTSGVVTENYGYDAFGNRWVTSPAPPTPETPTTQSAYSKTNRITGWGYDGSGNVTSITGMQRTFTYDAENRQVTATINGGTANTYVYDGDGRRVQKVSSAGTATYIYDAQGQLAAEYGTGANPVSGTQYLTADHLGSTRLITDGSANTAECLDYYPFGREIPTGANGRPSCYSSGMYPASPDIASEKFTGKERDAETGIDYFGARYLSSAQGRFTSPDPSNLSVDFWLPQTWNRYSYVLNNPLNMADRNGLWPFYIHNEIINEAFPGMSKQDLQILKEASARMDTRPGQQSGGQAPQHGMSNGSSGQTTAQAQQQGDAFIAEQEDLARQIQADWLASGQSGISPYALMAFGNALHTIEDRLSPAHIGSQPWYGQSAWSPSAWAHFLHESYITSFQMGLATSAAQRAFRNAFGFDAFTLMQLQQQQPPPPQKPTVTTKICYTLDNGTQVCQ